MPITSAVNDYKLFALLMQLFFEDAVLYKGSVCDETLHARCMLFLQNKNVALLG